MIFVGSIRWTQRACRARRSDRLPPRKQLDRQAEEDRPVQRLIRAPRCGNWPGGLPEADLSSGQAWKHKQPAFVICVVNRNDIGILFAACHGQKCVGNEFEAVIIAHLPQLLASLRCLICSLLADPAGRASISSEVRSAPAAGRRAISVQYF